jgi:site-specific recombinase XerD
MTGPLAPFAGGLWESVIGRGYTRLQAEAHTRLMGHLSRWMSEQGLVPGGLGADEIEGFVESRRAEGYRTMVSVRSLGVVLGHLRETGVLADEPVIVPGTDLDVLLGEYRCYLDRDRGLARGTVRYRVEVARRFFAGLGTPLPAALEGLGGREVTTFLLGECQTRRVPSAKAVATSVRCLLRFLLREGKVSVGLGDAVPTVANWRAALPRGVDSVTVARLLASCDRRTAVGRRDYAVLLVFVRLGLRAGEVAALTLDDVDWRAGELLVRAGKTSRLERMPLPDDVGAALAAYLRHRRPHSQTRAVFLRSLAPRIGLSGQGMCWVVRHACRVAGVAEFGPHRLRHHLASELLRAGASLPEIGQVLRQRSLSTTAIYAKIDRAGLAVVARPWPGVGR